MAASIKSVSAFIRRIDKIHNDIRGDLFYRGHTSLKHKIVPSTGRNPKRRSNEREFLYSLIAEHPNDFETDQYTFDRPVRAQHYEIPTRVLDLSSNTLIALYFACVLDPSKGDGEKVEDGRVLVFKAPPLATKFFMSDCVSCAANLVHLNSDEKAEVIRAIQRVRRRYFDEESSLITFSQADPEDYKNFVYELNGEEVFRRLTQFIREEKPYFTNSIDPVDLNRPYVVHPKKSNARIVAQSGAFILFGTTLNYGKTDIDGIEVVSIQVDGESKPGMLASLEKLGIHEGSVFPEMDKAAHRLTKKLS